ncbi:nickel-dependent hydrogenase large subunit [Geomonas propionica]|uniref:Nickel-dependent hydrogenase large subunit n=1 Tax=Geomonas propionica TaxID=2798582 RepID=A0ABS0YS89_9BACT|nr:nickel-dependent hydrogenase large subunit [Geomonas propionica]MBJ6800753.1 nickel-dependent hydrogenase large subunit [Geomonas propionica]
MAKERIVIDPITRIEGHLRIELETDGGRIGNAWACATQFRGIERVLQGRDPRDAWAFAQRICGVCTGVHAIASVRAVEDAIKCKIPPCAELIRSLVSGMATLQDHVMHFYHLHALDWVDVMSALKADPAATSRLAASLSPWPNNSATWYREVQKRVTDSAAGGLGIFAGGYWGHPAYRLPPEANLMALAHYLEALSWQREIIRLHTIFAGKNPHPNYLVGGMACAINLDNQMAINQVRLDEIAGMIDQARRFVLEVYYPDVLAIASFYPDYAAIGVSSPTLIATGESAYSCSGAPAGGVIPAGVLLDGNYGTAHPFEHKRIAEFVSSAWYSQPEGDRQGLHPWQGRTEPHYTGPKPPFKELAGQPKYTWCKAPRYDGRAVQVGPNARILLALAQGHAETAQLAGEGLGKLKAGVEALNSTLGRTYCRALESVLLARRMDQWFTQLNERIRSGDVATFNPELWEPESWPNQAQGMGFMEAARGTLSHWVEIDNRRISRYQAVVPSTWNSSGRDPGGQMGPFEQALAGDGKHPLADPKRPIEVLRTIHSFDPCESCAVHLLVPGGGGVEVKVQ